MTAIVLRVAGLVLIYLLVLTSVAPGDVVIGGLIGAALVLGTGARGPRRSRVEWLRWFVALGRMVVLTGSDIAVGTVRVVRFCLTDADTAGFVEIPRGDRSRHEVALWGILTGEAPDEYPVAIDDERQVLIVHNVDARDPAAIRARHAAARVGYQRDVVA